MRVKLTISMELATIFTSQKLPLALEDFMEKGFLMEHKQNLTCPEQALTLFLHHRKWDSLELITIVYFASIIRLWLWLKDSDLHLQVFAMVSYYIILSLFY